MRHLRLSHTEYENRPRLNRWVCSFVTATGRRFGAARDTFEEARAQAEAWAAENGIPCRMKDVLAEQAAADCASWRSELNRTHHDAIRHMDDVVCGKVEEPPLRVAALPDLTFHPSLIAVPTIGGILVEGAVDPLHRKFPAEVRLPVTLAAAQTKDWVVVPYQGRGVAMTILEAYERGLREAPCWLPDLTGVSTVPAIGEIADHLKKEKHPCTN